MTSPVVGSVLSNNRPLQVYSGPADPATWRQVIFPPGNVAHKVRLGTVPRPKGLAKPFFLTNLPPLFGVCETVPCRLTPASIGDTLVMLLRFLYPQLPRFTLMSRTILNL